MAIRRQKTHPARDADTVVESEVRSGVRDDLIAEMDDLLDEIDEALESNAEEFVRNYVQKGGE
jgi:ubiquitin-like protein Pup